MTVLCRRRGTACRAPTFVVFLGQVLLAFLLSGPAAAENGSLAPPTPVISDDLDVESLQKAIRHSIAHVQKLPPERVLGEQPQPFSAAEVLESLLAFEETLERWDCRSCWASEIAERFDFVPSSTEVDKRDVLFTGYFQPVVEASLTPGGEYKYPLYGIPSDLIIAEQVSLSPVLSVEKVVGRLNEERFVPYYSRHEIDNLSVLREKGHEMAWVKDPIALFFMHIQGSGILCLEDGRRLQVGYAASNGRPYRSIGKMLIDRGKLAKEEVSMQRLRQYLTERPDERSEVMAYNESYVFFRFVDSGPLGSIEVPLTAGRSIASDWRIFPKAALAFIVTQRPILDGAGQLVGWQPFSRFVLNQDTGGAIRGLQRADLYFGAGDEAGKEAGLMNSQGKLYLVVLKRNNRSASGEPRSGDPSAE